MSKSKKGLVALYLTTNNVLTVAQFQSDYNGLNKDGEPKYKKTKTKLVGYVEVLATPESEE